MTAAPPDPLESGGRVHDQSIFPGTRTWCHVAGLLVEGPLDLRFGTPAPQANELQGDGPARIVGGAVLVRATTPAHMTVNASTLPAIAVGPAV